MTGLDTVHLALSAAEVEFSPLFAERVACPDEKRANLLQSAAETKNFGLWRDTSDAVFYGQKAFVNAGDFTFEVLPGGDAGRVGLHFSGGAFTGDNSEPMDVERLRSIVPLIEQELEAWGVRADWSSARLSRADVARNIEMAHTVPAYLEMWRNASFRAGVASKFTRQGTFDLSLGTGRAWPRQWGVYDKGKERDEALVHGSKKRSVPASNLARFELRHRADAVGRVLEVERPTLGHLMQSGAVDALAAAHRVSARDELLSTLPRSGVTFTDETKLAVLLAQLREGSTPARYNADAARVASLMAHGGFCGAAEAWESAFAPVVPGDSQKEHERKKKARSRERRELRRVANLVNSSDGSLSGASRAELASELREKLLSAR